MRVCSNSKCKNKDNGVSPGICKECGGIMTVTKKATKETVKETGK